MSDANFERVLEEHNQAYVESEAFNDWMPPDGEYVVLITKPSSGLGKDKETEMDLPWWKIMAQIQEENNQELDGKEFRVAFYSARNYGMMKTAAGILSGSPVGSLKEASRVILSSAGIVLKVKVSTTPKKYKNCNILKVLVANTDGAGDVAAEVQ